MIVLDRDVLVKISGSDPEQAVLDHLQAYTGEEWTVPSIVAWESYKAVSGRSQLRRVQRTLDTNFDRVLDLTDEVALEAAYLDGKLREQDLTLDTADLLNLATAYEAGGTFVTRNKNDFARPEVQQLADVDVVDT